MKKKAIYLILIVSLLAPLGAFAPQPAAAKGRSKVRFILTILHNNDAESQLINLGPGVLEDFGGVARFKTLVNRLKWRALRGPRFPGEWGAKRGVIMVSSGDNFLAGPEFNASLAKGVPYYDTIAMALIGYDAVALGNHDFDFGPDVLANFIKGFRRIRPTYVSANLDFSGEPSLQRLVDRRRIARSTVVRERGERIGIIGAITPLLPFISSPRNVEVMSDVAAAVQAEVDKLEGKGVNKIILISHLQSIEEDIDLAAQVTGLDVVVAGGGDELLANPDDLLIPNPDVEVYGPYPIIAQDADGHDIPVVTTSGAYGYVGRLVVGFDKDGEVVMIDDAASGPVRVAGGDCGGTTPCNDAVRPNRIVQRFVVDPVEAYLEDIANTVVGTSEVDLDGVRGDVRTQETNEGDLIADSLLWQASQLADSFGVPVPDVALQNGGGIRNDSVIPAGPITLLDTFSMVPFPNFVSTVENVSREQFKEIMENAVSRIDFVDGRFAQISGFRFEYDPSGTAQVLNDDGTVATPGTRVREIVLNDDTAIVSGGAVQTGPPLNVATIDFLANGGDQYPFRDAPFTTLGVSYQQALADYIETGLSGVISAADYPEGGEGRIATVSSITGVTSVTDYLEIVQGHVIRPTRDGTPLRVPAPMLPAELADQ
jgi:2',3'-cyclic-nucleotide 2'-phosphodiesterase (5'-nucleotidase family)